jgi:hypothetical protein
MGKPESQTPASDHPPLSASRYDDRSSFSAACWGTPRRAEGALTRDAGLLSPLLANLLLDDLDKELERRGHRICRYADDCDIYLRSQAAGERVMASVTAFLAG